MKIKRYSAVPGSHITDEQAERIGLVMEELGDNVTPEMLFEHAKKKSSPIHDLIDWNAEAAAKQHWVGICAKMIRSVRVEIIVNKRKEIVRAYQSVKVTDENDVSHRVYMPTAKVLKHKKHRDQVVEQARRELLAWRNKYSQYSRLFGDVFAAIDELETVAA